MKPVKPRENPIQSCFAYFTETVDQRVHADAGFFLREGDVYVALRPLAKWKAAMAGPAQLTIVRDRSNLDDAPAVSAAVDENREFETRVAVDEQNLYVRYDVTTNHLLTNARPEDQIVFRGGNCLDHLMTEAYQSPFPSQATSC